MALTNKDKQFAELYVRHGFDRKAAYYEYNPKCKNNQTAYSAACRLLKKEGMQEYIASIVEERQRESGGLIASQEEVLQFLTAVMRGKIERTRNVVAGVDVVEVTEVPSINDGLRAAETLAKAYGMNEMRQVVEVGDSVKEAAAMTMAEKIKLLKTVASEVGELDDS